MSYEVQQTESFRFWLSNLRDLRARLAVARRITRAERGNLGDWKSLGGAIHELRIDVGPGFRAYFTIRERRIILLLAGGDKSSQTSDILKARAMAKELE